MKSENKGVENWYNFACVHHRYLHLEYLKLEKVGNSHRERLCTDERALFAQRTETHASSTPLGLKTTPSRSSITIDIVPSSEETTSNFSSLEEIRQEPPNDLEKNFTSWKAKANPRSEVIHRAARFIYNSEFHPDFQTSEQREKSNAYSNSEFRNSVIDDWRSSTDHEYEEFHLKKSEARFKYDILDYYERYSPTTAKTLIDTLLLPRNKICKQCARFEDSPVYSDRLIYSKMILYAREMIMFQFGDSVNFRSSPRTNDSPQSSQLCDYMPVCNLAKTNVSGILYFSGPQDVFDLKSSLGPEIVMMNSEFNGIVNTQMYHRRGSDSCSRISQTWNTPMRFQAKESSLSNFKSFGFNADLNSWVNLRHQVKNSRENEFSIAESQPNRASLLLLEPLIFMPSFSQGKMNFSKSRINHTEKLTLAKIVIAYTLAFVIVTIITFYVVYFT